MINYDLKLAIMRSKHGTQRAFAAALGVDETRVSQVVSGRYNLTAEEKQTWAGKLGSTVDQIFPEG